MDGTTNLKNTKENIDKMLSLERMCLDLIVQKFERFYFAFTLSNNVNIQRNFDFLQRRFSFQLLTALYENENLKEEYLELLINEHLHILNSKWLENSRYANCAEDIFPRLPNLTRVSFKYCDDKIPENIAKFCPNIVEFDVRYSKVTDVGVIHLCEKNGMVPCPKLKVLQIQDSDVSDVGAEYLIRKLPLLEKIDYPKVHLLLYSIYSETVSKHQKVDSYNLIELNLLEDENMYLFEYEDMFHSEDEDIVFSDDENELFGTMHEYFRLYNEVLKTCLTVCPKLESIACFITEKEQLNFFNSSHLKKLILRVRNMNPKLSIDKFIKMNGRNLTHLEVNRCTISISVLAENCPALEKFEVSDVNFTDEDGDAPIIFPCLFECSLSDIRASDAKAFSSLLAFSPKLESLIILSSVLSLEMKNQTLMWCTNSSAQQIKFGYIFLEMKFVRDMLLSCRSLKEMSFVNCSFDADEKVGSLERLAKRLPNKPRVYSRHHCTLGMRRDPDGDGWYYLRIHPEERYESSTVYDSLLSEIERNCNNYDSDEKSLN